MRNDHVNTEQAARILMVGKRTLEKWRAKNYGPKYEKVGSSIYYRIPKLYYWLGKRKWYIGIVDIHKSNGPLGDIIIKEAFYAED